MSIRQEEVQPTSTECPRCQSINPGSAKYCGKCSSPLLSPQDISSLSTRTAELTVKELTRGTLFAGRYEVIEELGEGGMGKVFRVEDKKIKEDIVLKLIRPEIASDKQTIERFSNELKYARKIAHRHVCRMYDLGEEEDTNYITMEYVPGENLKSMIRMMGQLSPAQAVSIATQVCEGLAEAHRQEVVHRDLKSSNIMIDKQGNTRIMDFGVARSLQAKGLTGARVMIGTPGYMSPEQVEGKPADQRSDIYSLGVILYEMTTGKLPFKGDSALSVAMKHKTEQPPDPRKLNSQVSSELSRMILRCMEKEREKRYQNVEKFLSELRRIEQEISVFEREIPSRKLLTLKDVGRVLRKRWTMVVLLCAVIAAVALAFLYLTREQPFIPSQGMKMLVVLPFENLGPPEDEYFADGLTEELTSRLSYIHGIGVISRTSAKLYKKTPKTIKQIGEELGVDYVLEGTVRWDRSGRSESRVRITPQLIQVSDDTHLWTDRFDRVIEDIFMVQTEIAEQVAQKLDLAIMGPERKALYTQPTDNLEAYDYYLQANKQSTKASENLDSQEFEKSIELFEKAIELDPDFTLAYISQSVTHLLVYGSGTERTQERLAKARACIDKAFELDPDFPSVKTALGLYYYWGFQDYDRALEMFESVKQSWPNFLSPYLGYIYRRQGKWEESITQIENSLKLNPRNFSISTQLGVSYLATRRYKEAEELYDRILSIEPGDYGTQLSKGDVALISEGNTMKARAVYEKLPRNRMTDFNWFFVYMLERKFQDALDHITSLPYDSFYWAASYFHKDLAYASIHLAQKEITLVKTHANKARIAIEKALSENPGDPRLHAALGLAYAYLDRREEAVRQGIRAAELYPMSRDAVEGRYYINNLLTIYTIVGDYNKAIDQLEYLLSIPSGDIISIPLLRLDPSWDPLREHPRFQRLLQ